MVLLPVCVVCACGLAQSRSRGGRSRLTPDLSRLTEGYRTLLSGGTRAIGSVVLGAFALVLSGLSFYWAVPRALTILSGPDERTTAVLAAFADFITSWLTALTVGLVVVAILAAVARFLTFCIEHRMTVEQRDSELDP